MGPLICLDWIDCTCYEINQPCNHYLLLVYTDQRHQLISSKCRVKVRQSLFAHSFRDIFQRGVTEDFNWRIKQPVLLSSEYAPNTFLNTSAWTCELKWDNQLGLIKTSYLHIYSHKKLDTNATSLISQRVFGPDTI